MSLPSNPPVAANLKPYTVTTRGNLYVITCDGVETKKLSTVGVTYTLTDLLNAAYTKGREDEGPIVEAAHEVRLNLATLSIEAQRDANYNGWLTKLRQALDERANPPKSAPPS